MKDELHTKTVITARISSDNTDLVRYKSETRVKKEKVFNSFIFYNYY